MQAAALSLALATLTGPLGGGTAGGQGQVVVADRASGTISVIDAATDAVTHTIALPAAANAPEPMYVEPAGGRLFVGDRANNRVVAYDPTDWSLVGTAPAGAGVFHMKADLFDRDLWVVNDVDNTLSVIDALTLQNIGTVPIPFDLVALGGKPHDVVVDYRSAYVSVIGVAGPQDFVVQFNRQTLAEINRIAVGDDPHLGIDPRNRWLYVPAQGGDAVHVIQRFSLVEVNTLASPGAHGAWMASFGDVFYSTNISGGGPGGLVTIDARQQTVLGATDTPYATPHNVASDPTGSKVWVTHSGATSDKVSIYQRTAASPLPVAVGEVTVGLNPFGITFVP